MTVPRVHRRYALTYRPGVRLAPWADMDIPAYPFLFDNAADGYPALERTFLDAGLPQPSLPTPLFYFMPAHDNVPNPTPDTIVVNKSNNDLFFAHPPIYRIHTATYGLRVAQVFSPHYLANDPIARQRVVSYFEAVREVMRARLNWPFTARFDSNAAGPVALLTRFTSRITAVTPPRPAPTRAYTLTLLQPSNSSPRWTYNPSEGDTTEDRPEWSHITPEPDNPDGTPSVFAAVTATFLGDNFQIQFAHDWPAASGHGVFPKRLAASRATADQTSDFYWITDPGARTGQVNSQLYPGLSRDRQPRPPASAAIIELPRPQLTGSARIESVSYDRPRLLSSAPDGSPQDYLNPAEYTDQIIVECVANLPEADPSSLAYTAFTMQSASDAENANLGEWHAIKAVEVAANGRHELTLRRNAAV